MALDEVSVISFSRALAALQGGPNSLDEVAATSPFGLYVDDPTRGCVYANPALLACFERTWEEFAGFLWARFVHPPDVERFQAAVARYEHTLEPIEIAYRLVRPSGKLRWIHVRVHAVTGDDGLHIGSVGLTFDVTAERDLRLRSNQTQQLEQVGRLAGRVAHDFNNLLCAILSSADLLELHPASPDEVRRSAEVIRQAVGSASQITRHLLTISRRDVIDQAHAELDAELRQLQPLLTRTLGEGIQLVVEPGAGLGGVPLGPSQLSQVVVNLALNARDALEGRGEVKIRTWGTKEGLVLEVSDQGPGMDAAVLARCQEPFFTTKEIGIGRGTGLGLATVRDLVELGGGDLRIDSAPRRGTRVQISLPRLELESPGPGASSGSLRRGEGRRVLLLEDHDALRQALGLALGMHGYSVAVARDLADARQRLGSERHLDALICDVLLPDGNGTELLEGARAQFPELVVILVSGFVGDVGVQAQLDQPGTSFLPKPFTTHQLLRALQAGLAPV